MTPPLPTLRALTAELRSLHASWGSHPDVGGEYATLAYNEDDAQWEARTQKSAECWGYPHHGREFIPGSVERECSWCNYPSLCAGSGYACPKCNGSGRVRVPSPFDAVAAARRLLAAAREAKP